MSILTTLALMVTSAVKSKSNQISEIVDLKHQIENLELQLEDLRRDRDFYRSDRDFYRQQVIRPSQQYAQATQAMQVRQAAAMLGALGMQAQQNNDQSLFCNCVPARQDFLIR